MAKAKDTKPLFPLKTDFYASLDRFAHEAGMLADLCRQLVQLNAVDPKVRDMLQERLDAFALARFGNEE